MSSSPRGPDYGSLPQSNSDDPHGAAGTGATENATPNNDGENKSRGVPSVRSASSSISERIKKKVPLSSFLWHQHSVLGMTVPDDHVTPAIAAGPCPCCEVDPEGLTRRRRMFLFFLVFFVSTTLAVQVSLGNHGDFFALSAMVLIVLPLVCHLKENLPTYSRWLMSRGIGPFGSCPGGRDGIRVEELALLAVYAFAMTKLWKDHQGMGMRVLDNVLWVWVGALVGELACLVFKYYCGKYCCCCFNCCVPTTYILLRDDDDDDEEANVVRIY
mmetsp:Transcript_26416/g.56181  ORF Transcript_26416/g.56181 Transcript_26416/m.56181 type:complete len:272 (+) Transcript_26416:82-897(+)